VSRLVALKDLLPQAEAGAPHLVEVWVTDRAEGVNAASAVLGPVSPVEVESVPPDRLSPERTPPALDGVLLPEVPGPALKGPASHAALLVPDGLDHVASLAAP